MTNLQPARSGPGTLLSVVCFFVLLATVVVQGRWLLADRYAAYASERLNYGHGNPATLLALDLSAGLAPLDANVRALRARASLRADPHNVLTHYREALRLAPANAPLWHEFARIKLLLGEYDAELERALRRVRALAPASLYLHLDNALLAVEYWAWAPPAVRELWLESLQFTLDVRPKWFLREVLLARREERLCREMGLQHKELPSWCWGALKARQVCFAPTPAQKASGWCNRIGFVRDPLK